MENSQRLPRLKKERKKNEKAGLLHSIIFSTLGEPSIV